MDEFDILKSVNMDKIVGDRYQSVTDRYYVHKYCTKFSTAGNNLDQRVSFHTNRICMISLAENHPVMKENKSISRINCIVDKIDRLANSTSGKGKRGAQRLCQNSILCYLECEDGTSYPVYSCVNGKLLEINQNILEKPNLILEKPVSEGFIALVLPKKIELYNKLKESLLTRLEYLAKCQENEEKAVEGGDAN